MVSMAYTFNTSSLKHCYSLNLRKIAYRSYLIKYNFKINIVRSLMFNYHIILCAMLVPNYNILSFISKLSKFFTVGPNFSWLGHPLEHRSRKTTVGHGSMDVGMTILAWGWSGDVEGCM